MRRFRRSSSISRRSPISARGTRRCRPTSRPCAPRSKRRSRRSRQVAAAICDGAMDAIADAVPAPPAGVVRAVVVNTAAIERSRVVEAFIDLPIDSAEPWRAVDANALDRPVTFWPRGSTIAGVQAADGTRVDFQILDEYDAVHHEMSRHETPWALNVRRVHVAWWAPSIPPCGYTVFDLSVALAAAPVVSGTAQARVTRVHDAIRGDRVE